MLLDIGANDLTEDEAAVLHAADPAKKAGMQVAAGGPIGTELSTPETESSEVIGIVAAMIILTFAFGSIVAMGMPILTAIIGLAAGLGLISLLGHLVQVPSIAPTLATMIGLGGRDRLRALHRQTPPRQRPGRHGRRRFHARGKA